MFTADLLERAAKTAVQSFLAAFSVAMLATLAHGLEWSVAWWQAAAGAAFLAGITAATSAITSLLSKPIGDKSTASIVPAVQKVPSGVSVAQYAPTLAEPLADEDHAA